MTKLIERFYDILSIGMIILGVGAYVGCLISFLYVLGQQGFQCGGG